jgi:HrpA-like RNA helicase
LIAWLEIKNNMSGDEFWKPAAETLRKESRSHEEAATPFNFSRAPLAQQRVLLPVCKHERQMSHAMENHGVIVIVSETGCEKATDSDPSLSLRKWMVRQ